MVDPKIFADPSTNSAEKHVSPRGMTRASVASAHNTKSVGSIVWLVHYGSWLLYFSLYIYHIECFACSWTRMESNQDFSPWTLKPQSNGSALSPSAMSFYASIAEVTDAYQIPSNKYLPSLKIHIFLQHDLCLLASTRTLVINWCHGIHKYL